MKNFRTLEWLWFAQALLAMISLTCLIKTNSVLFLVMIECLGFPFGWVLKGVDIYAFLPLILQYVVSYIITVANGGFFYLVLRFCFKRKKSESRAEIKAR